MELGIPSVSPDHQVAAEMPGRSAQKNFTIVRVRMGDPHTRFRHSKHEMTHRERRSNFLHWGHPA